MDVIADIGRSWVETRPTEDNIDLCCVSVFKSDWIDATDNAREVYRKHGHVMFHGLHAWNMTVDLDGNIFPDRHGQRRGICGIYSHWMLRHAASCMLQAVSKLLGSFGASQVRWR